MLKSKKFWSFEICDKFELTEEIISKFKSKGKFYEDGMYFYEQIGSAAHPSIKQTQGLAPTVISFQNILVDINTLKILFILLPLSKVTTLKFSSNRFNLNNLEFLIDSLLNKPNNINNFYFEWNDKVNIDGIDKTAHIVTRLEVTGTGVEYIYYNVDGEKDENGDLYLFTSRVKSNEDGTDEIIEIENEDEKKIAFEIFSKAYKELQE